MLETAVQETLPSRDSGEMVVRVALHDKQLKAMNQGKKRKSSALWRREKSRSWYHSGCTSMSTASASQNNTSEPQNSIIQTAGDKDPSARPWTCTRTFSPDLVVCAYFRKYFRVVGACLWVFRSLLSSVGFGFVVVVAVCFYIRCSRWL